MKKFNNIFFLGPKGSYSDAVKDNFKNYFEQECIFEEKKSISQIVNSLLNCCDETTSAIIPIENSIEGIVRESQDLLKKLADNNIFIFAETTLKIEHSLIGFASESSDIKVIKSHPQALAQCRNFIYNKFKDNVVLEPTFSTSNAVSKLSDTNISEVAIGSSYAANLYNIPIIYENINDETNNTTRFLLLSRTEPPKSEVNKMSIVFSTENKAGALNKALTVLENYNLNLSYIDSRPSKKELGEYIFYADFDGHIKNNNVYLALLDLQKVTKTLTILSKGALRI